jgi:hypothetical protein
MTKMKSKLLTMERNFFSKREDAEKVISEIYAELGIKLPKKKKSS